MLLKWHVKDPDHAAKSAGGRLHLNTHTPLTQRSRSGLTTCRCPGIVWEPIRKQLTHSLSGNIRPQSSQFAEPLWIDPDIKSGIRVRELISASKKKAQAGNDWSNTLPKSWQARREAPAPLCTLTILIGVGFVLVVFWLLFCSVLSG